MNRIIVTPAGRSRYLKVLYKNLLKCRNEFTKWIIWLNTTNDEDIKYIQELEHNNDFIEIEYCNYPVDPNGSHTATICTFFKNCIDENSVYLRLDDDIVFIKPGSIKKIFDFRIDNPDYFLVFGNILNNSLVTYLYQKKGLLSNFPKVSYLCEDYYGWQSSDFALSLHRYFLEVIESNQIDIFEIDNHVLSNYERCSINAISWTGKMFKEFDGVVSPDEEVWLSSTKPCQINKKCIIFGDSLFVHYAFAPQRNLIDSTDLLSKYEKIV